MLERAALRATIPGPWGPFHVAVTDRGVVAVAWLTTDEAFEADARPATAPRPVDRRRATPRPAIPDGPRLAAAIAALEALLAGRPPAARRRGRPRRPAGLGPRGPRRGGGHPVGRDRELRRDRPADRRAAGGAGGRWRGRPEPDRPAHPVPPGHRRRRHDRRLRRRRLGQREDRLEIKRDLLAARRGHGRRARPARLGATTARRGQPAGGSMTVAVAPAPVDVRRLPAARLLAPLARPARLDRRLVADRPGRRDLSSGGRPSRPWRSA